MQRCRILGVPYDTIKMDEALSLIEGYVQNKKPRLVVHLTLPLLFFAMRNRMLRTFLEEADIVIPTGKYLAWAARVLKKPAFEPIDPSIFVKRLLVQSADLGKKVYLFGGKGGTVDAAYENLRREIDKLFVIGRYRGSYRKQEHENIVTAIGKASPDYFLIGLGSPNEENWIIWNGQRLNAKVIVLVENLLDLYAGKIKKYSLPRPNALNPESFVKREIPHRHGGKMLWIVPVFFVSVIFEKLFRKSGA